jgi:hypothetical protein
VSERKIKIASLLPIILADKRRVTLEMTVENLPTTFSNVMFTMPDMTTVPARPVRPDPDAPSPYPNIELSILNGRRQRVASLFIIEHKERQTALTLHLPSPDPNEPYIARAELTYNDETLDVVETPFSLDQID